MSKYIDAEKLRAEIERRKIVYRNTDDLKDAIRYDEITDLLSFLDTLEEPVSEDLDKEIDSYFKKWWMDLTDQGYILRTPDGTVGLISVKNIARHFAEWQKAKMMENAVEADVMLTLHDKTGDISLHTGYLPKKLGIKYGDKVKIIIVKEDGE